MKSKKSKVCRRFDLISHKSITIASYFDELLWNSIVIVIISDIVIQILGIGKCEWTEQRRLFHAQEIYLKTEIKISEPTSGE